MSTAEERLEKVKRLIAARQEMPPAPVEQSELTPRQREIYQFILGYFRANQRMPTVREIGLAFQIGSPNGVVCHIRSLLKKGWIGKERSAARGLRIIQRGGPCPLCGHVQEMPNEQQATVAAEGM